MEGSPPWMRARRGGVFARSGRGSWQVAGGFGGIAELDEGVRAVLAAFGRVELSEARAQNARLPVFAAGGDLFLFNAIFDLPDFGAVIGGEAENDELEERLVGRKIELVMELRDEGAEFFEEGDAESFEVGGGRVGNC